jgi:hypothetical protein
LDEKRKKDLKVKGMKRKGAMTDVESKKNVHYPIGAERAKGKGLNFQE